MKKIKYQRLPNGFGSIRKLTGKRRKPYVALAPSIYIVDKESMTGKYSQKSIGTAETWEDAYKLLEEYHSSPYDLANKKTTLRQVFEAWKKENYTELSHSSQNGYNAAYVIMKPIEGKPFVDLRPLDFERAAERSGKNAPTFKRYKTLINHLYKYAIKYEIVTKDYRGYVDLKKLKKKNPNKKQKIPFSNKEIKTLWKHTDIRTVKVILMMIYSGVRIMEMLDLKKENVDLKEHVFKVVDSKTPNGIRTVPIADKTYQFWVEFMKEEGLTDNLLLNAKKINFSYSNFTKNYWNPTLEELKMEHTPHETRHTCASLLEIAGVDDTIQKKIIGHSSKMDVTERVYVHLPNKTLLEAINKI